MLQGLHRALAPLAGAVLAAIATGFLWALPAVPGQRFELGWRLAGLLTIPGACVGLALLPLAALCTPVRIDRVRAVIVRAPAVWAALAAVLLPTAVLWIALSARVGKLFFTSFHHLGLMVLAQAVAMVALSLLMLLVAAAGVAVLSRLMKPTAQRIRSVLGLPLLVGTLTAAAWLAWGIHAGNHDGQGGGVLGAFGVLKKPELDLSPVAMLAAIAGGGVVLALALRKVGAWTTVIALAMSAVLMRSEARGFGRNHVATIIEARPGLPRAVLRILRKRSDRDHDGYSRWFGGGDCDDNDARRNPGAVDIPGNGIDEDCSGSDAPRVAAWTPPTTPVEIHPPPGVQIPEGMSVVLLTVDTLRWDTHYAGNPYPITPRLDQLAAHSVVFDHAYALSSYTGKAVGPLLIGRYPTETFRDGEHFTRYLSANVMLAERLHDAGFHTFGGATHFYFERHSGLSQGMEEWDMSARPPSDQQESVAADGHLADRVIAMLQRPEATSGRFFLWAHFFDPHKQYVDHPDLPLFGRGDRARYNREVMSSDRAVGRVLDALDALPAAQHTVVIVTADHGEAFGEHGMFYHGVELWDELVRVPWIIRVPGAPPHHVATPRSQIDMVPTLLDLLHVPAPAADAPDALSGRTLMPDLLGVDTPARPIYIELPEGPFNSMRRSVVYDGWKLTERGAGHFELYHLADDPGEQTDVARTNRPQLARMRALMEQVRAGLHPVAPQS